jgi:hypothetical protein
MPIFGQVWLWSSLAFLLGAFLCWALMARPARKRAGQLQAELNSRLRRPPGGHQGGRSSLDEEYDAYEAGRGERSGRRDPARRAERRDAGRREEFGDLRQPAREGFGDLRAPGPETSEPLARSHGLPTREPGQSSRPIPPGGLSAPPETDPASTELSDAPTGLFDLSGSKLEAPPEVPQPGRRGWFDSDQATGEPLEGISKLDAFAPGELGVGRLVDDEAEAPPARGGTIFTEHTHPIPEDVIRTIDAAGKQALGTDEPADGLVDDLADDDASARLEQAASRLAKHAVEPETPGESETGKHAGAEVTSQPMPEAGSTGTPPDHGAQGQTEVMPVVAPEPPAEAVPLSGLGSGADESRRGIDEQTVMPGASVSAEPISNPLPKRVPGKPRGHVPFGVETSPTPEPEPAAPGAVAAEAEPTRSLFEPIVPAEDGAVLPPPHRVRGNGRGPFGPGSAMPLPDGGSPSPEFTIKASVSALRYCTPESPQFGRTVAEVWFKTPADAERVGFRPVG